MVVVIWQTIHFETIVFFGLGIFQGNLFNVIQQYMIAIDQRSTGCGLYEFGDFNTSGAKYGSLPTIP